MILFFVGLGGGFALGAIAALGLTFTADWWERWSSGGGGRSRGTRK